MADLKQNHIPTAAAASACTGPAEYPWLDLAILVADYDAPGSCWGPTADSSDPACCLRACLIDHPAAGSRAGDCCAAYQGFAVAAVPLAALVVEEEVVAPRAKAVVLRQVAEVGHSGGPLLADRPHCWQVACNSAKVEAEDTTAAGQASVAAVQAMQLYYHMRNPSFNRL